MITDTQTPSFSDEDAKYMQLALAEAQKAAEMLETPVGAVLVRDGEVVAAAHNLRERSKNALAHAELLCIDQACKKLGGWRLFGSTLYVTLEPCPMCAGAIINARIDRVVFGASDPKAGSLGSVVDLSALPYNHRPTVEGGLMADAALLQLREFFAELRAKAKENKAKQKENGDCR